MQTISLAYPVPLLTLAVTIVLEMLVSLALQWVIYPIQATYKVRQADDDRGSGRITPRAFRGSGRINPNNEPFNQLSVEELMAISATTFAV